MPVYMDIKDEYFEWMLKIIDFDLPEHRNYERLLRELDEIEFYWVVDMDENRDIDAYDLRKEFLYDCNISLDCLYDGPRTVLEVLVAFSKRIETDVTGEPGEYDYGKWFWVMLDNLGLLEFDNYRMNTRAVDNIVEKWLSRNISVNGKSGIFPIKKLTCDQRGVEMWYQMQAYLNENLDF